MDQDHVQARVQPGGRLGARTENNKTNQKACPDHAPRTGPVVAHPGRTPETDKKGKRGGEGEEAE